MHGDNSVNINTLATNRSSDGTQVEITPVRTERDLVHLNPRAGEALPIVDATLFLLPMGLMTVWAIIAFKLSDSFKNTRDRIANASAFSKLPCKNCQYYTNNPYLKCAVNPNSVLTEEALNCSDYSPKNKSK
jgi:hypothetical protein